MVQSRLHIPMQIWDMKYRLKDADGQPVDKTMADTWGRVAGALAAPEEDVKAWESKFFDAMADFRLLPAGRILSGARTDRRVTLFNCFVMGDIPDDMSGIFEHLKEAALTMQQGGGIGYDFSTLRPKGARVRGVGADASGPLSFMDVWDAMCLTIMSAGQRRGAMMGVLACDHPDIEAFIEAKRRPGRLRMFNLSVLVTDAFMRAVKEDAAWELTFDDVVYKSLPARALWDKIMRATYAYAEPGVVFIDRVNRMNPLAYCETIHGTNPCGEQPLPPYGACLLGSVNLARLIERPFEPDAALDLDALGALVTTAVRMLDNVIEVSRFPLPQHEHEAKSKRRIGLGVTGLADGPDPLRRPLWRRPRRRADQGVDEGDPACRLSGVGRLGGGKGIVPPVRQAAVPGRPGHPGARRRHPRRHRRTRHPQRAADLGRPHRAPSRCSPTTCPRGLEPVFSFEYTRHLRGADGTPRSEEGLRFTPTACSGGGSATPWRCPDTSSTPRASAPPTTW